MGDGDVFAVPEGVFREESGVGDLDIFASVERIIADEFKTVDDHVFASHGEIGSAGADVSHFDVGAVPEGFGGV